MTKAGERPPASSSGEPRIPPGKRAEVLSAVLDGLSDRQVAKRVGVAAETVSALRKAPAFAAEVAAEFAAVRERRNRVIERGALVGMRRLMKDAKTADDDRGTRAAIELAKLGLSVKSEVSGPGGKPQEHKLTVDDSLDKMSEEEILRAARAILDAKEHKP